MDGIRNLYSDLPEDQHQEHFQTIAEYSSAKNVRIERIVTYGQCTPAGEWYDQVQDEWVMVVQGDAVLLIEREDSTVRECSLKTGDSVLLPAHCRHRVEKVSTGQPVIWLAVHIEQSS